MSQFVPHAVKSPQVVVEDEQIFEAHAAGKLSAQLKAPLDTRRALAIGCTPGVAQVSRAIVAVAVAAASQTEG